MAEAVWEVSGEGAAPIRAAAEVVRNRQRGPFELAFDPPGTRLAGLPARPIRDAFGR